MVKLSEAVAAYAGAVSEHQLMVSGVKWSEHTAAELLTQYPAATVVRLAHEADSKAGECLISVKALSSMMYVHCSRSFS
jgi:hypothetical protein